MSQRSVCYLMSGPAHLPYLIVSIASLRRYYHGPIRVHAWPESIEYVNEIARDLRLGITTHERSPLHRGKNGQFLDKILMIQSQRTESSIYLDADTMVVKPIDRLFRLAEANGFCATQFNLWKTTGGIMKKRIGRLRGRAPINQRRVEFALKNTLPSTNGGVWAARPESIILDRWYNWTLAVKDIFIADETVLQVVADADDPYVILPGGGFNCSPKYGSEVLDQDVSIWHFHGDSNVRPNKSQKGIDLWMPVFEKALEMNLGFMADWIDREKQSCGNKYLKRMRGQDD